MGVQVEPPTSLHVYCLLILASPRFPMHCPSTPLTSAPPTLHTPDAGVIW